MYYNKLIILQSFFCLWRYRRKNPVRQKNRTLGGVKISNELDKPSRGLDLKLRVRKIFEITVYHTLS